MKTVLVIGGGAIGCITAFKLVQRGYQVTIVDKGEIGQESSRAGGGILLPLLPWNYREEVNQLAFSGIAQHPALYQELLTQTGIDPEYYVCGMEVLPPFDRETALTWCAQHGVDAEMKSSTLGESLWLPQVAQIRPPRLMRALRAWLFKHGVRIIEHTEVQAPTAMGEVIWQTTAGELLPAEMTVVTTGAWAGRFLQDIYPAPIKPIRGQILQYQLTEQAFPHIYYQDGFYIIPRKDGVVIAGSTLEDVGFDKNITEEAREALKRKSEAIVPQLKNQLIIKHWCGLRPGSPDNIPLMMRHPDIANLYFNVGHFRYGVTMAPESAERLVQLMDA